jgi:hypothetical protein
LKQVKFLLQNLYKKGTRKMCKIMLKSHRDDALDADTLHEFERALLEAGLPPNVEEIPSNEDCPPDPAAEV